MFYAITADSPKALATPGTPGRCRVCGDPARAKCGRVVAWHWAHIAREDCDTWAERDTAWHSSWQTLVPPQRREVILGNHRADIVTSDKTVIELQHSTISVDEIRAREEFYQKMIWVFDVSTPYREDRLNMRSRGGYHSFRWKHPRKTIAACQRTVFLDLGNGQLLRLKKMHTVAPCGGWGYLVRKSDLASWLNGGRWPQPLGAQTLSPGPDPEALAAAIAKLTPEQRAALGIS